MLRDIDNYYLQKEEPVKSCLLALRTFIMAYNENISEAWKYKMPFYCYKGKMFCYLWVTKKTQQPYIGMVEGRKLNHPLLIIEKRNRMKIMLIDPQKDLPLKDIKTILKLAMEVYNKPVSKSK